VDGAAKAIIVPQGPLEADFARLRDAAAGAPLREAIATLAAKPGVGEALAKAYGSTDRGYLLRLHRVKLLVGDAAARRAAIEASLKGDGGAALIYTVVAALDLDAEGFRAQVAGLQYSNDAQLAARAWADAALDHTPPRSAALTALGDAYDKGDEDLQRLVAPALVLGGDGGSLGRACEALEADRPTARALAKTGLEALAQGTGPADGDAAAWRTWVSTYGPLRDLVARACADPGADLGAHIAAKRDLLSRAAEALPLLPVLLQDKAVRTVLGAQTIGDLLAFGATPADAPVVKRVLTDLGPDRADEGGVFIVRGALLACDDAVADEAAGAIARGAVDLEAARDLLPDLVKPAGPKAQDTLTQWVGSLGDGPKARPARIVAASFRGAWLESWVLDTAGADRVVRDAVAARLGSARLERKLLDLLDGQQQGPAGFPGASDALNGLASFGGEDVADKLARRAADAPTGELLQALKRIGDARHARRLKKLVETSTDAGTVNYLFETYAALAGREAGAALARRTKPDDPFSASARQQLLRAGGREARALAREPWEALTAGSTNQRLPQGEEIQALVRSGTADDGALFRKVVLSDYAGDPRRLMILGIGQLGYSAGIDLVSGYIFPTHPDRTLASISAALLGAKDVTEKVKLAALYKENAARCDLEGALCVAALAVLSPDEGKAAAQQYLPAAGSVGTDEAIAAVAFALALAGDDDDLRTLARNPQAHVRAATARGISLAALSRKEGIAALPVMDDLRLDPEPSVKAEIAVARGVLSLDGAARDIVAALYGPDSARTDQLLASRERSLLQPLAWAGDLPNLQALLFTAYDACTPGDLPFRPDLCQGRKRELLRKARAALVR
jgi:hypothetical protein